MVCLKSFLKIVQFCITCLTVILTSCTCIVGAQDDVYSYRRIQNNLLINLDYASHRNLNTAFAEELSQPYFLSGLSYYSKRNFDLAIQGGIALNADTSYSESSSELSVQAGYLWDLSPSLKIRPSFSHYVFSKNSHPFQSLFSDILQLDLYYQKKWYYGGIFNSYLFGDKNTFYGILKNGVSHTFDNLPIEDLLFGISFEVNLLLGDKNYYNPILFNYWDAFDLAYWGAEQFNISPEALYERIQNEGLDEVRDWMIPGLEQLEPGIFDTSFRLSSVNMGLPLMISYRRMHLYVFPMLIIPTSSTRFFEQDLQLIVSMGVSFSIF